MIGNFPPCEADEYLLRYPEKQRQTTENSKINKNLENKLDNEAKLLKTALEGIGEVKVPSSLSLNSASCSSSSGSSNNRNSQIFTKSETEKSSKLERIIPVITLEGSEQEDDEDAELQRALQLSLEDANDDVKNPLALRLDLASDENATRLLEEAENDDEEDDELRRALQLSLEGFSSPTTATTSDQDEVRWRHLPILSMSRTNTESTQKLNT